MGDFFYKRRRQLIDVERYASIIVPILLGALIGFEQWLLLTVILGSVALMAAMLFGALNVEDRKGWFLSCGCVLTFLSHGMQKNGLPAGYILELIVFGFGVVSLRRLYSIAKQDKALRILIALVFFQFALSILSSLLGRSHKVAAFWQFQYNLKWPLMFGLGMLIVWTNEVDRLFSRILALSWLFILPVILLEAIFPRWHSQIFGFYVDGSMNPFLSSGIRYRGPFSHSGYLAIICAPLATGAFIQALINRSKKWGLVSLLYGGMVLASGQRQETAALAFLIVIVVAIHWRRHGLQLFYGAILVFTLGFSYLINSEELPLQSVLAEWGVSSNLSALSERAILTKNGLDVAINYYPFGSGLGTYGGAGAQKFDLSLFIDLGFRQYWWFRQGKFIVDTYWPNIIAESGIFGAILLLLAFILIWLTLLHRSIRVASTSLYIPTLMGLSAITILFANTPSSAVITDPRGAFVLWILIGAAWRATSSGKY